MASLTAIIVNPRAGSRGGDPSRVATARRLAAATGRPIEVLVSEYPGHAVELARRAVADGARLVCAWGGDGTVNEVARTLVHTAVPLGVIPGGSGNGFARELGLFNRPARALDVALHGHERLIDAGELDGRLFVNLAGVGLDARIAALFNRRPRGRRGFWRYLTLGWRELLTYRPRRYELDVDGERVEAQALMIVLANLRQYGNGARIAPRAVPDDGRLDLVVVGVTSTLRAFLLTPRLFLGNVHRARGIDTRHVTRVTIASDAPLLCHADGESFDGARTLVGTVRPRALRVKVR